MKRITRRLITVLMSVIFSFVALGTVTFAWFTLTNVTTLAPFEVDVSTSEGIMKLPWVMNHIPMNGLPMFPHLLCLFI